LTSPVRYGGHYCYAVMWNLSVIAGGCRLNQQGLLKGVIGYAPFTMSLVFLGLFSINISARHILGVSNTSADHAAVKKLIC